MLFAHSQKPERKRWSASFVASAAIHIAVLIVILHRPEAIFVRPSSLARGNGLRTTHVVVPQQAVEESSPLLNTPRLALKTQAQPVRRDRTRLNQPRPAPQDGDIAEKNAHAGVPFGSAFEGPTEGHDIRPAFPVVFPDPPIYPWQIPSGIQGDIVVEVTIDDHGNVIETRLLQSIGHGIDEKVLATLQTWRFKPAMMDGRPIASKHDVHFHLPG